MNPELSLSAQKVQQTLHSMGYEYRIIELEESTRTAQEAAERVGCLLGQIVKSMIFKGQVSGKAVLVLTSGSNRVDEVVVSQYAGEQISRADAEYVRSTTGFAIGGVPPIGHLKRMEAYLDEDLLQYGTVWAAGGTPRAVFELTPLALQEMTGAQAGRVKV